MSVIDHVVPQVGPIEIALYSPADRFLEILETKNERRRLSKLRHLGALSFALEGARLARWDYTVALLYYTSELSIPKFNSKFTIGGISFSSTKSALQVASLAWNIGHLPGTFSVEKGVYRHLYYKNPSHPASSLNWSHRNKDEVKWIIKKSNDLLLASDFYALSKVLAVYKLLSWSADEEDLIYKMVVGYIAPLFLDYDLPASKQWSKIREAFKLIRHAAYLTLDAPFSGDNWIPSMPDFFKSHIERYGEDLYCLSSKLSESLSPIELNIYDRLYHSEKARVETAIYAKLVSERLDNSLSPSGLIGNWLDGGLIRDLKLGRRHKSSQICRVGVLKFRAHYSRLNGRVVKIERDLINRGYCHSSIFKYHSWNSDDLLEPDEYTFDILKKGDYSSADLGRLVVWVVDNYDSVDCEHSDYIGVANKLNLEDTYKNIFSQAVKLIYPDVDVGYDSWPLNDFGLFPYFKVKDHKGSVWSAKGKMEEKVIRHILRDRTAKIQSRQLELYRELAGVKELRSYYRGGLQPGVVPRCRWIIFTCSVTFNRLGQPFMEFDGGALKISARSGAITWYGLETKSGNENPASSLRRKMKRHKLRGQVFSINTKHAFVEMNLDS